MSSKSVDDSEPVLVGRVLRAHGIRGEVRVEVLSDVEGRFSRGREMWLRPRTGPRRRVRIEALRRDRGTLLVRFEGIADRNLAEEARGASIEVDTREVPPAPEGLYYHFELVGCECHDQQEGLLGRVSEIVEDGGGDMLVVENEGQMLMVPFVEAFVVDVDVTEKRRIDLRLPSGLVEICTSRS